MCPKTLYFQAATSKTARSVSAHNKETLMSCDQTTSFEAAQLALPPDNFQSKAVCNNVYCPCGISSPCGLSLMTCRFVSTNNEMSGSCVPVHSESPQISPYHGVSSQFPSLEETWPYWIKLDNEVPVVHDRYKTNHSMEAIYDLPRAGRDRDQFWSSGPVDCDSTERIQEPILDYPLQSSRDVECSVADFEADWNGCHSEVFGYDLGAIEHFASVPERSASISDMFSRCKPPMSTDLCEAYISPKETGSVGLPNRYTEAVPMGIHQTVSEPGNELSYPPLPDLYSASGLDDIDFSTLLSSYSQPCEDEGPSKSDVLSYSHRYPPPYEISLQNEIVLESQPETPQTIFTSGNVKQHRHRISLRDKTKDEFLVQSKQNGMSYKEIKEMGGFEEAESTLRGRYRTLTKPKEGRLRKPRWTENDISILKRVVKQYLSKLAVCPSVHQHSSQQHDIMAQYQYLSRVSWKDVAEHMSMLGCYRFGNATVKKKYMEIMDLV